MESKKGLENDLPFDLGVFGFYVNFQGCKWIGQVKGRWNVETTKMTQSPQKSRGSLQFFCTFSWFKGSVVNAAKCLAKKRQAAAYHVRIVRQVAVGFAFEGAAIYIQINAPLATLSIKSAFPSTGHQQIRYASYTSIFSNKLWKWMIKWDIENKIELNYFPLAINPFIQQLS